MNNIFFIGDFVSDTGPAIANRNLFSGFSGKEKVVFSKATTKLGRILEVLLCIPMAKSVCMCSSSVINKMVVRYCKLLGKKCAYLMHGYIKVEEEYSGKPNTERINYEQMLFSSVDKIVCVSSACAEYLKKHEPKLASKIVSINNAIPLMNFEKRNRNREKDTTVILSLGGGYRQKNNLRVAEAVGKLIEEGYKLKYVVVGSVQCDTVEIIQKPFVDYFEHLEHDEVLKLMNKSDIYVQNSYFETFGMAVIEALFQGCDLLVSQGVGAVSVFDELPEEYIISNMDDVEEIADKIKGLINASNNESCRNKFKRNAVVPANVAADLKKIIRE